MRTCTDITVTSFRLSVCFLHMLLYPSLLSFKSGRLFFMVTCIFRPSSSISLMTRPLDVSIQSMLLHPLVIGCKFDFWLKLNLHSQRGINLTIFTNCIYDIITLNDVLESKRTYKLIDRQVMIIPRSESGRDGCQTSGSHSK
jgi:hypothetical protein